MSYYTIKPTSRAACLSRIEQARKVQSKKLWRGMNGRTPIRHEDSDSKAGSDFFRSVTFADQVADVPRSLRDHKGWFTGMEFQDGTLRGIVAYVGHGRWLAGYRGTDACDNVYYMDAHDSAREAAIAADEHARVMAERECEYQDRWRAAQALQDKVNDGKRRLRELLALRHRKCLDYVRGEIDSVLQAIRDAREELATDYKDVEV